MFQICSLITFRCPLEVRRQHDQHPEKLGPPGLAEAVAAPPAFLSLHLQAPGNVCNMPLQGQPFLFQDFQGRCRLTWGLPCFVNNFCGADVEIKSRRKVPRWRGDKGLVYLQRDAAQGSSAWEAMSPRARGQWGRTAYENTV